MTRRSWYRTSITPYMGSDILQSKFNLWASDRGYVYGESGETWATLQSFDEVVAAARGRDMGRSNSNGGHRTTAYIAGKGWAGIISGPNHQPDPQVLTYEIWARTADVALVVAQRVRDAAPEAPVKEGEAKISFVTGRDRGDPSWRQRLIEAPSWMGIRDNYASGVAGALDRLVAFRGEQGAGKVVIVRGSPGTGKTYFLLSLAREWESWASVTYVTDPERFFGDPSYLYSCITRGADDDEAVPHSKYSQKDPESVRRASSELRVFLMEDVDEYIAADSKLMVGQGLSRLLNLVDGILGVGLRILIVLSTNESIDKLHKALIRPGRCLMNIEFKPLAAQKADEWRAAHDLPPAQKTQTLAELYAALRARGESPPVPGNSSELVDTAPAAV